MSSEIEILVCPFFKTCFNLPIYFLSLSKEAKPNNYLLRRLIMSRLKSNLAIVMSWNCNMGWKQPSFSLFVCVLKNIWQMGVSLFKANHWAILQLHYLWSLLKGIFHAKRGKNDGWLTIHFFSNISKYWKEREKEKEEKQLPQTQIQPRLNLNFLLLFQQQKFLGKFTFPFNFQYWKYQGSTSQRNYLWENCSLTWNL